MTDSTTPINAEELNGLIPNYISLKYELDMLEELNILSAERWVFSGKRKKFTTVEELQRLHKKMFGSVWKWAGTFRKSDKNIGISWYEIPTAVRQLSLDVEFQLENGSFEADELCARFHHKLVFIHPFPNGNGRLSRLAADALVTYLGNSRFSWSRIELVERSDARKKYIEALRAADRHDYSELLEFVRS